MLTLTRKIGERIFLDLPDGRRITVTYCDWRQGRQARIGIEAPDDVKVLREELENEHDRYAGKATAGAH